MLDEGQRDQLEKLAKSEYFEYLVKQQIRAKIEDMLRKQKWVLRIIGFFIVVICVILGYKFWDIGARYQDIRGDFTALEQEMATHKDKLAKFDNEAGAILAKLTDEANKVSRDLEQRMADQQMLIDERRALNENYFAFLEERLDQTSGILSGHQELTSQLEGLTDSTQRSLGNLRGLRESLTGQCDDMSTLLDEIKIGSSTSYLFVELGDRSSTGKEYRPAAFRLPYSDLNLTAVFYKRHKFSEKVFMPALDKEIKRDAKVAYLEITIDGPDRKTQTSLFELREHEVKHIPETDYYLEAIFIYLQPNPFFITNPLFIRIPDLVILKVFMMGGTMMTSAGGMEE